jgi:hypothetical protein
MTDDDMRRTLNYLRMELDGVTQALEPGQEMPDHSNVEARMPWLILYTIELACLTTKEPLRHLSYALGVTSQKFTLTRRQDGGVDAGTGRGGWEGEYGEVPS